MYVAGENKNIETYLNTNNISVLCKQLKRNELLFQTTLLSEHCVLIEKNMTKELGVPENTDS